MYSRSQFRSAYTGLRRNVQSIADTINYSVAAQPRAQYQPLFEASPMSSQQTAYAISTPVIGTSQVTSYQPTTDVYGVVQPQITTPQYVTAQPHTIFAPQSFLSPRRSTKKFINCTEDIIEHMEEAFMLTTGKPFPNDVSISICSRDELKRIHEECGGSWSEGIQGFALNRFGRGQSEIFIRENPLDELLLTIGHEIGHILSPPRAKIQDEEAKAFAFQILWMNTIKDHNIAGCGDSFVVREPAHNGIHDVALAFVLREHAKGRNPQDVFADLLEGTLSLEDRIYGAFA